MGTGHFFRFDPNGSQSRDRRSGINQLTRAFLERRCVRSTFSAADEKIAAGLFHSGLPIADAEHAILLGSLRKYMALINNGRGTPITSLRYFTALFDEVKQDISPGSLGICCTEGTRGRAAVARLRGSGPKPDEMMETK